MSITVTGISYDYLAADAVHICQDAMQTPFDGCITTFAEVRCLKRGVPSVGGVNSQVTITWGDNSWYGYSQGVKSAPCDADRINEYTVTVMDAMGYLNNVECNTGGTYSFASFAQYILSATGVTVDMPETDAYFNIDHLMPDNSEEDAAYPTFGRILQELGVALGVCFAADTSQQGKVICVAMGASGSASVSEYPGAMISVCETYSSVSGKWSAQKNTLPEFDSEKTSMIATQGIKVAVDEDNKWVRYEGMYAYLEKGGSCKTWVTVPESGGYIGYMAYGRNLDSDFGDNRIDDPSHSGVFMTGWAFSDKFNIIGEFKISAKVFINPMYSASDPYNNIPMLWRPGVVETNYTNKSCIYINAHGTTVNPTSIEKQALPMFGWHEVIYTFNTSDLSAYEAADIRLAVNTRNLIEGDYGTGVGRAFVTDIRLVDAPSDDDLRIYYSTGGTGKPFKIDTSFVAPTYYDEGNYKGKIVGASTTTDSVLWLMKQKLGNSRVARTYVISSSSVPSPTTGCQSFNLDVAKGILSTTQFI